MSWKYGRVVAWVRGQVYSLKSRAVFSFILKWHGEGLFVIAAQRGTPRSFWELNMRTVLQIIFEQFIAVS